MGESMSPLEELGKAIADAQNPQLEAHLEAAREKFAEGPAVRRRLPAVLALAAALAVGLIAGAYSLSARPLTFELSGARAGVVKEWLEADGSHPVPIQFSDGTTLLLSADARGRVEEVSTRGARVQLDRGAIAVSVPPGKGAQWTFGVGPFEVFVTGTRFDVGWDARQQVFELTMKDGSVKVRGPSLASERVVVAGQSLRIPLGAAREVPAQVAELPEEPVETVAPMRAPAAPKVKRPVGPRGQPWRELAAEGKFAEALAAALVDFDRICAKGTAAELIALGDSARYAKRPELARAVYLKLRERFARSPEAALAAFALGRMAFESDQPEAIEWFSTSLGESPTGPLAREALGRLMESHLRQHHPDDARRMAAEYLRAWPDGPHARLARSLSHE
jgi:transmembrane sensor